MFSPLKFIANLPATRIATSVFALAALTFGTPQGMTGGSVEAKFRGEWVPARAACTSPLRLIIEPTVVTFVKGTDRAEYRKLDQCFTCAGHDVENVTLLSTDAMGDSPFTIYLDGSKRKASLTVLYNDSKLGKRFPFGTANLKKCK
ncbi:MAG TPA: hypothetical protein VM864_05230 [Pyrinomonadaceae bacterium]|jgi:hypothetical protein|nr:hypothetical protein [Pyrinomonadaceae bacterium]